MNRSASTSVLPWVAVAPDAPYFVTEAGDTWTPIGQNDAVTWPELAGVFRRRDMASVERYFRLLQASGVTVLRLMLEYNHGRHRFLERPAGVFQPNMVRLWDDLIALCQRFGLRLLLTPYTTLVLPGLRAGGYRITAWDTNRGTATDIITLHHQGEGSLCIPLPPVVTDLALAVRRC